MDTKTKIENANAILSDKGNVIKTRDDRELIMVDKDGKVTNPDDCNWMPDDEIITKSVFRSRIEPWLTSLFQSEHLSLLCGSGITNSISYLAGASGGTTMETKRNEWGKPSSTFPQEKKLTERERIICVVRTKLAYALADVANSLLMDCEHTYNRVALGLKPAEKSRFKYLQQQAMRLKYAAKDATKTMYDLDMDAYYDDSDRLQEFLLLLVDRTAADEGRFEMARHSLERMKSILGLYPKEKKKKEGLGKLLRG